MKKSALLVALSAASLAGGIALAQTQPQTTKPDTKRNTKPETTRPATGDADFSLSQLDKNKDGAIDKQEAKASPSCPQYSTRPTPTRTASSMRLN